MSDHKPFAYYDTLHDKLLWAEGPQYVHAQRTEGMSLKPLYLHPPRPEPEAEPVAGWMISEERRLLARAGLIIAKYRWNHPEDPGLQRLSQQIHKYFNKENLQKNRINGQNIIDEFENTSYNLRDEPLKCFVLGVRWAEKHHGIGGGDE